MPQIKDKDPKEIQVFSEFPQCYGRVQTLEAFRSWSSGFWNHAL